MGGGASVQQRCQALRGTALEVDRAALPAAAEDEVYHADLIGMVAETPDGTVLGRLVALHDFGFRAVISSEIADIFRSAGFELSDAQVDETFERAKKLDTHGRVSVQSFRMALNGEV